MDLDEKKLSRIKMQNDLKASIHVKRYFITYNAELGDFKAVKKLQREVRDLETQLSFELRREFAL
jgi:hypothetical protein